MAHRTFVNHYDFTARELLSGPDSKLSRIIAESEAEPTLNIPF